MVSDEDVSRLPFLVGRYTRVNYLRSMATIHLSTIDQYPSMPSEVDIVLPYCGEDVTWLLDMLTSNTTNSQEAIRDRIIQSSVSLRIYNKCPDRVAASRSVEGLRERLLHVLKDATVVPSYDWIRGDECTGYLHFLIQQYDHYARWTLFIHPDSPEHMPKVNIIMDVMKWAATGLLETLHPRLRFAHLSHNFLSPFWARADRYRTAFKELYSDVMNIQLSMAPEAAELSTYCCTQLLVRDDALRVRSFDYYERLYNRMNSVEIYKVITRPFEVISNDDIKSRLPCQLMMPLWQVIFGNSDDMSTVERPLDPNMPLFLKTANLDGDWVNAILAKNMINHE